MSSLCRPTALDELARAGVMRAAAHSQPRVCAESGPDQVRPRAQLAHVYGAACQLHGLVLSAPLMPRQAMQGAGTALKSMVSEILARGSNKIEFTGDCH